ncbi:MAG: sulfite exporter TauE/SafE family protein [Oscillospiraceae bacterium]|nr:sulfite exporter TauE/SafE family protein [Oscillospiraceae bacterium]
MIKKLIVCFLAGAGAGIGTGFAGMSAAAIIGPMLTTFLGIPAYEAIGIGLASDVLASGASALTYRKNGNLDIKNSLPLLVTVLAMTIIGSMVANLLPDRTMTTTTQIVMIIVGFRFIAKPVMTTREQMTLSSRRQKLARSVIGGIIVGFICGFVGAGGGIMMLIVLTSFLGYEMHIAVGTSVFIMMFTALTGSISHFALRGQPDIACLVLCIAFTLMWARIAAKIANKASDVTLSRVVGCVLIISSVVIIGVHYMP